MSRSTNRTSGNSDRPIYIKAVLPVLAIWLGLYGCQTNRPANQGEREAGDGIEDRMKRGEKQSKSDEEIRLKENERQQIRSSLAELMQQFASDRPQDWRETAKEVKKFGEKSLPDGIQKRIERAQEKGPEGERARNQLVRWGRLKSIVLELPSRDPAKWDNVRKRMLNEGQPGREMFVRHMLDFLKKPDQNRLRAAEQLAKCGQAIVDQSWTHMKKLATNARKAAKQGKSIKGAMIILEGLAQVQVHADRWQRIQSALQHSSIRIRMATAQALGQTDQIERATKLLGKVVRQDPEFHVRNTAVKTLGVFDHREEPIKPLADALQDTREEVVKSAAEELRYFHKHEQAVVRAMIDVLGKLKDNRKRQKNRKIIHSALQDITDESSVGNSYRDWAAWYRMNYDG